MCFEPRIGGNSILTGVYVQPGFVRGKWLLQIRFRRIYLDLPKVIQK